MLSEELVEQAASSAAKPADAKHPAEPHTVLCYDAPAFVSSCAVGQPVASDEAQPELDCEEAEAEAFEGENGVPEYVPGPKHPLQTAWTMWYNAPFSKSNNEWKPRKICTFDTVEDFWCLYNNLLPSSRLVVGSNYHLFKAGIEPEWEDKHNEMGGKWVVSYKKSDQISDNAWLLTMLSLIGEGFEDADDICGAVISPRKGAVKLGLWTRDASNATIVRRIGTAFKTSLSFQDSIGYQSHQESLETGSSFRGAHKQYSV